MDPRILVPLLILETPPPPSKTSGTATNRGVWDNRLGEVLERADDKWQRLFMGLDESLQAEVAYLTNVRRPTRTDWERAGEEVVPFRLDKSWFHYGLLLLSFVLIALAAYDVIWRFSHLNQLFTMINIAAIAAVLVLVVGTIIYLQEDVKGLTELFEDAETMTLILFSPIYAMKDVVDSGTGKRDFIPVVLFTPAALYLAGDALSRLTGWRGVGALVVLLVICGAIYYTLDSRESRANPFRGSMKELFV
jgi:hypothetical protein